MAARRNRTVTLCVGGEMKTRVVLDVFGPCKIPHDGEGKKKRIDDEHIAEFWGNTVGREISAKQGCYVFALQVGKGYTPWYVGKATKTFKQECFTSDKTKKYNRLLWTGRKGSPVMFFVAMPGSNKKISAPIIADMEKFLIQSAVIKNDDILNVHHTRNIGLWGIRGIIRGGKWKTADVNRRFGLMMGI